MEPLNEQDTVGELAPASARETAIAKRERVRRLTTNTSGQQSDASGVEVCWSFDVSKALTTLRSDDQAVRQKALQRLHTSLSLTALHGHSMMPSHSDLDAGLGFKIEKTDV